MWREFREFLFKQNALALAVGVIVGTAMGRVVTSIVSNLLMPVIGLGMPGGDWRTAQIVLSETTGPDGAPVVSAIKYGSFLGAVVDFVIVAFVVFMILRTALKPAPENHAMSADHATGGRKRSAVVTVISVAQRPRH